MNFKVAVDPALKKLINKISKIDETVREDVWQETLDASKQMESRIKTGMPVDTGRARASWGRFTPGDLKNGVRRTRINKTKAGGYSKRTRYFAYNKFTRHESIASAADAIWVEDKKNLSVTQGTKVYYVIYLNEGHSTQAPAAFIDAALEKTIARFTRYGDKLGKKLANMVKE